MKLVTLLYIILCLKCCFSITFHQTPNHLQMIVDVIGSYEQPTVVLANVCWPSVYKSRLARILALQLSTNMQYLSQNTPTSITFNNQLLYLIDYKCESSKSFLQQASAKNMFSKGSRWLILGKINDTMEKFADLNILVDSEFIVSEEQNNGKYLLHLIYKIHSKSDWIQEYFGTWTPHDRLSKSKDRVISNAMRRKDFKQNPITVSVIATDNRTKLDYGDITSNIFVDTVTKSSYSTITNLYDFVNASRVIVFSETWGYLVNGTWTGMIGDIDSGKADLCGSVVFISKERMNVLEFIRVPTGSALSKIVFRQPPLSYQFNLFILPFTSNVWYCFGALVIIFIIVLYVNAKWDIKKYEDYKEEIVDETYLKAIWSDIIIFVVSAISQQGSSTELKGSLGRLVMFIVFLAFLFFYTSYSASIVVLLQSTSNQIRTVTDLMNSKLELGIEGTPYNKYYFSAAYARDPIRKAFYDAKISPKGSKPNFMSIEEGVKKMQTAPFAFNMNTGSGYRIVSKYFQEHEKCGLVEIDYIQASKTWFSCKKTSPYKEIYRVGFSRIEEHGLSDRNNRLIYAKKPTCTTASGNFGSVNMLDFYPVLLMQLYGMILAFALLIVEILLHRRQKMKESLNSQE